MTRRIMTEEDMMETALSGAVYATLASQDELDSNGEPANVVDGLFAIAHAINRLAAAIEESARRGDE